MDESRVLIRCHTVTQDARVKKKKQHTPPLRSECGLVGKYIYYCCTIPSPICRILYAALPTSPPIFSSSSLLATSTYPFRDIDTPSVLFCVFRFIHDAATWRFHFFLTSCPGKYRERIAEAGGPNDRLASVCIYTI